MNLQAALDRHVATGALTQTAALGGIMFTATTDLGRRGNEAFTLHLTIVNYHNGEMTTRAEVWSGDELVRRAPLEVNWPAVKALREMDAGDKGRDVIARLLNAAL